MRLAPAPPRSRTCASIEAFVRGEFATWYGRRLERTIAAERGLAQVADEGGHGSSLLLASTFSGLLYLAFVRDAGLAIPVPAELRADTARLRTYFELVDDALAPLAHTGVERFRFCALAAEQSGHPAWQPYQEYCRVRAELLDRLR